MIKGILIKLAICGTLIPVVFSSRKSIAIIDETSSIKVEQSAPLYLPKKEAVRQLPLDMKILFLSSSGFPLSTISEKSLYRKNQCRGLTTNVNL